MSQLAAREQSRRREAARPGGARDKLVWVAKWALPAVALLLLATLVLLPLSKDQEISFLVSKQGSGVAGERLRIARAMYRGETTDGRPFEISAAEAVQKTSETPVVVMKGMEARLEEDEGPARVTAPSALYNLNTDILMVAGPVVVASARGYALDSRDVRVDLKTRRVSTAHPVIGQLPVGTFKANGMSADIQGRRVVLEGDVRLRIRPSRATGART